MGLLLLLKSDWFGLGVTLPSLPFGSFVGVVGAKLGAVVFAAAPASCSVRRCGGRSALGKGEREALVHSSSDNIALVLPTFLHGK